MADSNSRYALLSMDEEEPEPKKSRKAHPLERRTLQAIICAAIASLICTAVNIVYVGFPLITQSSSHGEPSLSGSLEFVSPYIGLDFAIHHDSSPLPPIVNFPILLAQIDAAHPTEVLLDTHKWNSSLGMVYPADRTFKVAPGISSIAQFRAIDWGMELCTLNVVLPGADGIIDFMNFTLSGSPSDPSAVMVEIWRVSSPEIRHPIDAHTLSWRTRPQRKLKVGYWSLKPGVNLESEVFDCVSNSLHTFEFMCLGPNCHLQFQQDPNDSRIAFYITQRQSKQ